MSKTIMVKCPQCEFEFSYYTSEFRPFCCEKCQKIDLGEWLTEGYTVKSNEPLSEEDVEVVLKQYEIEQ